MSPAHTISMADMSTSIFHRLTMGQWLYCVLYQTNYGISMKLGYIISWVVFYQSCVYAQPTFKLVVRAKFSQISTLKHSPPKLLDGIRYLMEACSLVTLYQAVWLS